jgi:type II secretory pathway pseudopilin PulG
MIGLAPGNKPGFGILEIVIGIALLAVLGSIIVPNYMQQQAGYEQKKFVTGLNAIMSEAWQRALMSEKIERIKFDFKTRTISVEQEIDQLDKDGNPEFEPIVLYYADNNYQWSESFDFKQFFINQEDEMAARGAYGTTDDAWFYVMPSGMAQPVIINFFDTKNATVDSDGKEISLVLNPFTIQFRVYNDFQIPSA